MTATYLEKERITKMTLVDDGDVVVTTSTVVYRNGEIFSTIDADKVYAADTDRSDLPERYWNIVDLWHGETERIERNEKKHKEARDIEKLMEELSVDREDEVVEGEDKDKEDKKEEAG